MRTEKEKMGTGKENVEKTLLSIERSQPGNEAHKGVIAGAYALWLVREKGEVDVDDFPRFLDEHESDVDIRRFLVDKLANHWNMYRRHITQFDKESLKQVALEYAPPSSRRDTVDAPQNVIELAVGILDIAPGDHVADLGAGLGTFLCRACARAPQAHYTGYENLPDYAAIALIRAKLLGGDVTINTERALFDDFGDQRFDKAFCPPIWGRWDGAQLMASGFLAKLPPSFPKLKKNASDGWIYAMMILSCLKDGGKGALMLPAGGLSGKLDAEVRRYLLERQRIKAVVLLPRGIYEPFTNIQMALVILGKNHPEVMMVDASGMGARNRRGVGLNDDEIADIAAAVRGKPQEWAAKVGGSEIIAREDMNPAHYTQDEVEFQFPTTFGDVIKEAFRGNPMSARMAGNMDVAGPTPFQCLSTRCINDGMIDEDLPYLQRIEPRDERYCLRRNDIVLAKSSSFVNDAGGRRGGRPSTAMAPFKVALADPAPGRQIIVNDSLLIIRLDQGQADPGYIKAFLESDAGQAALRRIAVGTVMQTLGVEAIKDLRIPLPPMSQQRQIAARHQDGVAKVARLRRELDAARRDCGDLGKDFDDLVRR